MSGSLKHSDQLDLAPTGMTLDMERVSRKQIALFFAGMGLALVAGAPALLKFLPGSKPLLIGYSAILIVVLGLTVGAFLTERLRRFVQRQLPRLWARKWFCWALALLSSGIYLGFLWYVRIVFRGPGLTPLVAAVAFSYIAAAWVTLWLAPMLTAPRSILQHRAVAFLGLLVLIVYAFYLWGQNLFAQWWIIDDEGIVEWLGQGHHLALARVPLILANASGFTFFSGLRFRPVFWIFQTLETVVWGDQPFLWYFFRIAIFILAFVILWRLITPLLGMLNGLLFTLLLGLLSFWTDIFARLGPAENYALLGLCWYAFAFVQIVRDARGARTFSTRRTLGIWALLGVGGLICMGAKENFVWLLVPNVALLAFLVLTKRLSRTGAVTLAVLCVWGVLTLATLFVTTQAAGVDAYSNSVSLRDRLPNLLSGLKNLFFMPVYWIGTGLIVVLVVAAVTKLKRARAYERLRQLYRLLGVSLALALFLVFVLLSQLYIYNGALPQNTRYDFPGMLVPPFFALLGFFLVLHIVRIGWQNEVWDRILSVMVTALLLGLLVITPHPARVVSALNAERTRGFTGQIQMIHTVASQDPNAALVLETHSGWDYEPTSSLVIFLRHAQVNNPVYLHNHIATKTETSLPFEQILAQRLEDISSGAIAGDYYQSYRQLQGGSCYSVAFSGQGAPLCNLITEIKYR